MLDEELAGRVRKILSRRKGVAERRMFGGIAFLVNGHMACGVHESSLMLRLGTVGARAALARPHVRPMDLTGRALSTMVFVDAAECRTDARLKAWVEKAVGFAATLPPKQPA